MNYFIKRTPKEMSEFDLLDLKLDKLAMTMNRQSLAILQSDNKQFALMLNVSEATVLVFVQSGCAKYPHIPTIHHLFLSQLDQVKSKIKFGAIESKDGDVYYARLCIIDHKGNEYFCKCTAGDLLILCTLANAPMKIIRKVLNDVDDLEDELDEYQEEDGYGYIEE